MLKHLQQAIGRGSVIRASADVGSDKAGVDDPGEATQIASVDHAATLNAEALPPPKHGSFSPSAINPGGGCNTVQQAGGALGSGPAGSRQGGTDMHTVEHQTHTETARAAWQLRGGR